MESANPTTQDVSKSDLYGVLKLIFGFLATIQVSIVVVGPWGTYGWVKRIFAILLVVNMLMLPVEWAFTKKGRVSLLRSARFQELWVAYIWVMLTTLVFNHL